MRFSEIVGQDDIKNGLIHEVNSDHLTHAQLFAGPEGSGKLQLALAMAQYLLCENRPENDSCGVCASCRQVEKLEHPDLHLSFPVVLSATNKIECSDDRLAEWKELYLRNKYISLNQWQSHLDELGKNAVIGKVESQKIQHKLSLTSFSGRYKIMVIWLADNLNLTAANKLLKLLEEPPDKTIFLLTTNSTQGILPTIISRTQVVKVPKLTTDEVEGYLNANYNLEEGAAHAIAGLTDGNVSEAIEMMAGGQMQMQYFDLFVQLMRAAYAANPMDLMDITDKLATLEKVHQRNFLRYGLKIFRDSIILNYLKGDLVNLRQEEQAFLAKFARFINNQNITELHNEFNEAHYHLERNANSKILFSDLVIRLTKLIKKGV